MSWGHAALGLAPDADERAIKRAYAAGLRHTRPDEDPAGFQRLHQAYQAALAWVKEGVPAGDEDAESIGRGAISTAVEQQEPGPGSAMPVEARSIEAALPSRLDVPAFAQRVIAAAAEGPPLAFARWLAERPELWPLQDKQRVGDAVLHALLDLDAPIRMENFDALGDCFDWDDIASNVDPFVLHDCRRRLHRHWVVQPPNGAWLAYFLHRPDAPVNEAQARAQLAWLTRPWQRWRAVLTAAVPGRVPVIGRMLTLLGIEDAGQAPPPLQPAQVAFWLDLTRRGRITRAQLEVVGLRSLLCALAWLVVIGTLAVADRPAQAPAGPNHGLDLALYGALSLLVGGMLVLPFRRLLDWQSAAEAPQQRGRHVRLLFIPLLAVIALALIHAVDQRVAGTLVAVPALVIALVRWWRRGFYTLRLNGWMLLALWPAVKLAGLVIVFGEISIALAVIVWAFDAVNAAKGK